MNSVYSNGKYFFQDISFYQIKNLKPSNFLAGMPEFRCSKFGSDTKLKKDTNKKKMEVLTFIGVFHLLQSEFLQADFCIGIPVGKEDGFRNWFNVLAPN